MENARTEPPVISLDAAREERAFTQSSSQFFTAILGSPTAAGQTVSIRSALGVPAIWASVNFLSRTLASLPLHVYDRKKNERVRARGPFSDILNHAPNDGMSSFDWRKYVFGQFFTHGRGMSYIDRDGAGRVANIIPLDVANVTVERMDGLIRYMHVEGGRTRVYQAAEILDFVFMRDDDGITAISPITCNKDVVGMAQAMTQYGGRTFDRGGVPAYAALSKFNSPGAIARASSDLNQAIEKAAQDGRNILPMPEGLDLKPLGVDPEKMQMIEAQRFIVEQIARIYSIPPTFLQDLTHGTFSNTEQEDLRFVKHTLHGYARQIEQELGLKLLGRTKFGSRFIRFNMDGLMRGDLKSRMDAHAAAIQNGVLTPNEVREMEKRAPLEGGDKLFIQGATVPLANQTGATNDAG